MKIKNIKSIKTHHTIIRIIFAVLTIAFIISVYDDTHSLLKSLLFVGSVYSGVAIMIYLLWWFLSEMIGIAFGATEDERADMRKKWY